MICNCIQDSNMEAVGNEYEIQKSKKSKQKTNKEKQGIDGIIRK